MQLLTPFNTTYPTRGVSCTYGKVAAPRNVRDVARRHGENCIEPGLASQEHESLISVHWNLHNQQGPIVPEITRGYPAPY